MTYLWSRLLTIMLLLVACDATNTLPDVIDPTPTPETVMSWGVESVPDGIIPINPNPGLKLATGATVPFGAAWSVIPNGNHDGRTTYPELINGQWVFPLAGQAGEGFAGSIGVELHNLNLEAGQCYALNLAPGSVLDLREVPKNKMSDISARAWLHYDGQKIPLGTHAVTRPEGFNFVVLDDVSTYWFWTFQLDEDATVVAEFDINQFWANARMGNNFILAGIYVHPVDPALCD